MILIPDPHLSHILFLWIRWLAVGIHPFEVLRGPEACDCVGHADCSAGAEDDEDDDVGGLVCRRHGNVEETSIGWMEE